MSAITKPKTTARTAFSCYGHLKTMPGVRVLIRQLWAHFPDLMEDLEDSLEIRDIVARNGQVKLLSEYIKERGL